jgi:hypothetical protein
MKVHFRDRRSFRRKGGAGFSQVRPFIAGAELILAPARPVIPPATASSRCISGPGGGMPAQLAQRCHSPGALPHPRVHPCTTRPQGRARPTDRREPHDQLPHGEQWHRVPELNPKECCNGLFTINSTSNVPSRDPEKPKPSEDRFIFRSPSARPSLANHTSKFRSPYSGNIVELALHRTKIAWAYRRSAAALLP